MTILSVNFGDFERIYPTENDIAFADYNGVNSSEVNFTKNLHWRNPKNAVLADISGGGLPLDTAGFVVTAGVGLTVDVTAGRAYIQGRYVEIDSIAGPFNVTLDPTRDSYLYFQLNIAGVVNVSPPAYLNPVSVAIGAVAPQPSNSVLIAKITTDATAVVSIVDLRASQKFESSYIADISTDGTSATLSDNGKPVLSFAPVFGSITVARMDALVSHDGFVSSTTVICRLVAIGPNGRINGVTISTPLGVGIDAVVPLSVSITNDIGRYADGQIALMLQVGHSTGATLCYATNTFDFDYYSNPPEYPSNDLRRVGNQLIFKEWNAPS